MPRQRRPENKGLPKRWQHTHGAYYFRVPPGEEHRWEGKKRFRLGSTLTEAYRSFADRMDLDDAPCRTIGDLIERYLLEVLPTKAPKTRRDQPAQISRLRAVFGEMPVSSMLPKHVYRYARLRKAKTAAKREIEILSHIFTKAVEWGDIDRHPFRREVRIPGGTPRTRYVDDWEIEECFTLQSKRRRGSIGAVQAYIRVKLLTGMSRGDLLRLEMAHHFKEDGIHVQRHKTAKSTGKTTVYEWTDELRRAVRIALDVRPAASSFLFCNSDGCGYFDEATGEAKGWDSLWQGFMTRVLKETKVTVRFTEHDLRAKVASDADTLDRARALMAHIDARLTQRIYRRKPERVRPLK